MPGVPKRRRNLLFRIGAVGLIALVIGGSSLFYYAYLTGALASQPLTISHRGVDDGNGSKIQSQRYKPPLKKNRIMLRWLHETKDHQFVVMHDENLKDLTGVDAKPHQLTLSEMTKLTARENGHTAKVAGLTSIWRLPERLHQKLLIEIKTTPEDSPHK